MKSLGCGVGRCAIADGFILSFSAKVTGDGVPSSQGLCSPFSTMATAGDRDPELLKELGTWLCNCSFRQGSL
jgi:hypothetical protein